MNSYITGTTVRLHCTFKDFNDEKIDPQIVKVIIYDYKYNIIEELVAVKRDIGEYFVDYITPIKSKSLYYEWYGEIDGMPSIKRDGFTTKFI